MRIKICGLKNTADAVVALEAGADFLGFNFYPKSPRYIAPAACAQLVRELGPRPQAQYVGIFVNEAPATVRAILDDCGLHLAQLHGEETSEVVSTFKGRAFKAFRGLGADHATYITARGTDQPPAFLVDAYTPNAYGGTGHTADWPGACRLAEQYPLFLAGGLTPDNVAEAFQQVRPWGVDVASGVESAPGVKDQTKIRLFIRNARNNDE